MRELNASALTEVVKRLCIEANCYLPGDLQQKVDPYLRPLYDALFDMLGPENFQKYQERGNIEVAPLAYMRGRTLDDSFIILDEAQNTTPAQMKMDLTSQKITPLKIPQAIPLKSLRSTTSSLLCVNIP